MLRTRINGAILLTFVVMAGVFALIQFPVERQRAQTVMRKAHSILDALAARDADPLANAIVDHRLREIRLRLQQMLAVEGLLAISVFDRHGRLLIAEGEQPRVIGLAPAEQRQAKGGRRFWPERADGLQRLNYLYDIRVIGERYGFLHIAYSLAELDQERRRAWMAFGSVLGAMLSVMLIVLNIILSRAIIRPIQTLRRAMQRMQADAPGEQVRVAGDGELGELAQTFNVMSQALQRHQAERDRLNAQLRQHAAAQHRRELAEAANRAKSEFLRTISHEIRTPLNAMLIGLVNLRRLTTPVGNAREHLERIAASGQMLQTLVNGVLDLSAIEAGEFRPQIGAFDAHAVVNTALEPLVFELKPGVELTTQISPDLPARLRGDRTRVIQVLTNLVSNAVKFTSRGTITVSVAPAGAEFADMQDERCWLRFTVQDSGPGMSPDERARVFEPFFRGTRTEIQHAGGTGGLGLTIVRKIVAALAGEVTAQSHPGLGTRVDVLLPFTLDAEPSEDARSAADADNMPQLPAGLRVLLVEDSASNPFMLAEWLTDAGCAVATAADGQTAFERWQQAEFDVILMDVQMPTADGVQIARDIRAAERGAGRHVPIIALTAAATTEDRERCLDAGMDAYLPKPVDLAALTRALAAYAPKGEAVRDPGSDRSVRERDASFPGGDKWDALPGLFRLDHLPASWRTDPAKQQEYVALALRDVRQSFDLLADALTDGDLNAAQKAAHKLKGVVAGQVSAPRLQELVMDIEARGQAGDLTAVAERLAAMRAEFEQLTGGRS